MCDGVALSNVKHKYLSSLREVVALIGADTKDSMDALETWAARQHITYILLIYICIRIYVYV